MAFQPCPMCAELVQTFAQVSDGVEIGRNVFHFSPDGMTDWDSTTIRLLAEKWAELWDIHIKPVTSSGIAQSKIATRGLAVEAGPVWDIALVVVGTVISPVQPANVTLAIGKKTGAAGPGRRGRWFHCGLAESQVTNSRLVGGVGTTLLSAYADIFNDMASEGYIHVLLSRSSGGVPFAEGELHIVTDYSLFDSRVDTQKRRLRHA